MTVVTEMDLKELVNTYSNTRANRQLRTAAFNRLIELMDEMIEKRIMSYANRRILLPILNQIEAGHSNYTINQREIYKNHMNKLKPFYHAALFTTDEKSLKFRQEEFRFLYPTRQERLEFIRSMPEPKQKELRIISETLSPNNP